MARKKMKYPVIDALEITEIAAEGKALGRFNDLVVFVPFAVPGDVVKVQINAKKRRFMEGYILEILKASPLRVKPFCKHYGDCGGCKWQLLPYSEQLRFKQQQVVDQLSRIGKMELPEIRTILASKHTTFYRNKLEFTFSRKKWRTYTEMQSIPKKANQEPDQPTKLADYPMHTLEIPSQKISAQKSEVSATDPSCGLGFHIPGMFDKILDIDYCWLQDEPSNAIRNAVRSFTRTHGYDYYDVRAHEGLLRNLIIRTTSTGEVMVIVVFGAHDPEKQTALLDFLTTEFPSITALLYVVNPKFNDTIGDLPIHCHAGRDHIFEEMEGLRFKIGPKSFYQTNSEQAYQLYKVVRELAELRPEEVLYDLYTGTGTIANFVARSCRKVIGIEYVPEAIEDAKINARLNNLQNTDFYAGDMKDLLTDSFIQEHGAPNVIILDPPRAGIHEEVANTLLRAAPRSIVYVSCNPATQARDLAILDAAYRITAIQPVDMFPHTHHVENVVALARRTQSEIADYQMTKDEAHRINTTDTTRTGYTTATTSLGANAESGQNSEISHSSSQSIPPQISGNII